MSGWSALGLGLAVIGALLGAPGLILSLLVLKVVDPPRGQHDPAPTLEEQERSSRIKAGPWYAAYADLVKNRTYVLAVLGYAAYTFALGALAFWMPAFLERERGMPRSQATVRFGVIALVTGLIGTFSGGWLGDYFLKRTPHAYLWVSGIATLIAAPLTYLAVSAHTPAFYLTGIVLGELFIFVSTGPVNSAIINAVSPAERATAVGLSVLVMHGLGDIPSPPLIGILSDHSSLERAFVAVPIAIVVAGLIWMYAAWRGDRKA